MASLNQIVGCAGKRTQAIRRTLHLIYASSSSAAALLSSSSPSSSSSFRKQSKLMCERQMCTSSQTMKFLSESTAFFQDGTTIDELPILIRRATRDTYPFFSQSHSYSGDKIHEESEFDFSFKQMLQDCNSVNDVFNLLEVPSDKVRGHSAVYALQRLHVLMSLNSDWLQIHSFIRKAVIGELYHLVESDIGLLSNFSLITLLDCYFAAEGFSPSCFESLNQEISHRLVEGLFSVEELLNLVQSLRIGIRRAVKKRDGVESPNIDTGSPSLRDVLSVSPAMLFLGRSESVGQAQVSFECDKGVEMCRELLQNVWVHLASRYRDMDENTLPWTMQLLPREKKKFIFPLLDKQLSHVWPQLSGDTATMCLDNLLRLRTSSTSMMTKLARWAYVNIHLVTPPVLLAFCHVFLQFSFTDTDLIHVMEKCLAKSGSDTPTHVLALCVEYLRACKYVSPIIMDVVADHFSLNWESYNPLEIFAALRTFGHLCYLPANPQKFLFAVETCLDARFDVMDIAHLSEVLASFTFVNILPKNFRNRMSIIDFSRKIGALKRPDKLKAVMWMGMYHHALGLEHHQPTPDDHLRFIMGKKQSLYFMHERGAIKFMETILTDLFGHNHHHVIPFYSCCVVYINKEGVPLEVTNVDGHLQPLEVPAKRLALLLRSANHFTFNTRQLLGAQRQRVAQLQETGFQVVEIPAFEFLKFGPVVLKSYLSDAMDFGHPDMIKLAELREAEVEVKYCQIQNKLDKFWKK